MSDFLEYQILPPLIGFSIGLGGTVFIIWLCGGYS